MKKIVFPCTNRVHEARQKLLIDELHKEFDVEIFKPDTKQEGGMAGFAILCAVEFNNFLATRNFDAALIRADRFELLQIAGLCAYKEIPIVHIEGGNETGSGIVDSKVRHAISELADIHLVTDEQSKRKVIYLGANSDKVFNVGSLDVSFAKSITPKRTIEEDYILFLHHAIPGEDSQMVYKAINELGYRIIGVKSNSDYKESLMHEEFSPEEFISLMYYAKCFVGNSSAACKEASILGVPVILTGRRQDGRTTGHNVLRVPHERQAIIDAVRYQITHGQYEPDEIYYQPDTEKKILEILKVNV